MSLFELIDDVQRGNQNALGLIIDIFEPKINKLMKQTNYQNREDLRQELYMILIKKSQEYNLDKVPCLDEFIRENII